MKNTVYIITHKDFKAPALDDYKVLVVGANKNNFNNNYLKDNIGDNISNKNNSYSELTGLYWIWKNDNSDHVGLVHYRRYFVELKNNLNYKGRHIFFNKKNKYRILTIEELEKQLLNYEILVKESFRSKYSNEKLIRCNLGDEIWENMTTIINKDGKYIDEYNNVSSQHTHLNCNMFYGHKTLIEEYSKWLFEILNKIDLLHFKKCGEYYRNRELGYLSEILFKVWLDGNNVKYGIVDAVRTDDDCAADNCINYLDAIKLLFKNGNSK